MTTTWKNETPATPKPRQSMHHGPLFVTVCEEPDERRWKYFSLSFGRFDTESLEQCQADWPHDAIEQARAALDAFEAELAESAMGE